MKKLVLVAITPFICFAQMDDYLPLSEFSDDKKIEYNFTDKQKKQELKKEEPTVKVITKEEKTVVKPVSEYKEEIVQTPIKQEVEVIEVRKSILNDEVKQEDVLENKSSFSIDNNIIEVKFEYSPIDIDISSSTGSLSENSNAFSPIISVQNNKDKFSFEFFMTDKEFETKVYKLNYKRIFDKFKVGVGLNRYEISANSLKARENYLSIQGNFTSKISNINNLWFDVEGSVGKGDNIDALEYKITLGYQNDEFKESSYILGYKGKEFESEGVDLSYKGPFIGVKTLF